MSTHTNQPTSPARRLPLLVIGVALVIWGQISLITNYFDIQAGLIPTAIGLVVIGYVWLRRPPSENAPAPHADPTPPKLGLPGIELIVLGVVLAVILGLRATRVLTSVPASYAEMFTLWGLSIVCFAAGTVQSGELRVRWEQFVRGFRAEPREWGIVAALTVLALAFRLSMLETAPAIMSFDEGSFAQEGAALAEGRFYGSPFEPAWLSHPRLFFFIVALSVKAFGRTVMAARLPAALFGALTIPAVYVLGRRIFGRRVGLASAIFLTGFHMHLHFSRLALNNIADPLWGTLAFSLLLRGLETGRLSDFGLSGLALGMSQYFYAGARLIPVIMVGYLIVVLILRPQTLRGRWLHLLFLVLGVLVITWPIDFFYIWRGHPLTTRLSATGLFQSGRFNTMRQMMGTWEILWDQTKWAWLGLIHTYDRSGFYGAIAPIMGPYAGGVFLLGAAYSLLRLPRLVVVRIGRGDSRDEPGALLPALWIIATVFAGSALLIDPPQFPRYVLLLPAAAILVGLGVVETFEMLLPLAQRARARMAVAVSLALMIVNVIYYFDIYIPSGLFACDYNTAMGDAVARYLREETTTDPTLTVYYLAAPRSFLDGSTLVNYFTPDIRDHDLLETFTGLPPDYDPLGHNLFILNTDRLAELEPVTEAVPGGVVMDHRDGAGRFLFASYRVPPP